MGWSHNFQVRALLIAPGANAPAHTRAEEEVLLVHSGNLSIAWPDGSLELGPGDTLTVPIGIQRSYHNRTSQASVVYVVRGGDHPKPALWAQ